MRVKTLFTKCVALASAAALFVGGFTLTASAASDVDAEGYTKIYTVEQLDSIREKGKGDGKYRLYADLDLYGYESKTSKASVKKGWYPIGYGSPYFTGEFDGNGHTISGLWSKQGVGYTGLFSVTKGATITNLNIELAEEGITGIYEIGALVGDARDGTVIDNVHVQGGSINVTGGGYAGGLVGHSYGKPRVEIKNSSVTGTKTVTSGNYSGGIIGVAENTDISGCYAIDTQSSGFSYVGGLAGATKTQSTVTNCVATGTATGKASYIGGLIGIAYQQSEISGGYAFGNVTANHYGGGLIGQLVEKSTVFKSCAYGDVTVKNYIAGGLVGEAIACTISNTYARGDVSGTTGVGGLVGYFSGSGKTGNKSVENSYSSGKVTGKGTGEYGAFSGRSGVEFKGTNYFDGDTCEAPRPYGTSGSPIGNLTSYPQMRSTDQMMTEANFKGWDFTSIWKIDENETYPYFEEDAPKLGLEVTGNLKQNRKIIIDGTTTDGTLICVRNVDITVKPVDSSVDPDVIKIDPDTSNAKHKELIIKEAGEYEVTLTVKYIFGTKTEKKVIKVLKDKKPVADINTIEVGPIHPILGSFTISKLDYTAISNDGDEVDVMWRVWHDADEDGNFTSKERTDMEDLEFTQTGDHQVRLIVTDKIPEEDTISKFLTDDDYQSKKSDFYYVTIK